MTEEQKQELKELLKELKDNNRNPGPGVTFVCETVGFAKDVLKSGVSRGGRVVSSIITMFKDYS